MKEFLIFKVKEKKNEKSPDYNVSAKIDGKFTNIGGAWLRTSQSGEKFFSCKLSDTYGQRIGYSLIADSKPVSTLTPEEVATLQALRAGDSTKKQVESEINVDSIPF